MDVYVSLRKSGGIVSLAICDRDLLGKTLKEGKMTFHVNEKFYHGSLVSVEEAIDLTRQSTVINMVGRGIVKEAIERGLVHPEAVLKVEGVPHAQVMRLRV